jgi:4,5-DOPA dioxygenase extradiol
MSLEQPLNRSRFIYFAVLLASFSIPLIYRTTQSYKSSIFQAATTNSTAQTASTMSRTPVYFLGIGGPNFMENTAHPAYSQLAAVGQEITMKVKPKAVVVISAHWQDGPNKIKINVAEHTDLIYDFYGFPPHYYEYDYPNKGSPEVAEFMAGML